MSEEIEKKIGVRMRLAEENLRRGCDPKNVERDLEWALEVLAHYRRERAEGDPVPRIAAWLRSLKGRWGQSSIANVEFIAHSIERGVWK